VDEPAGCFGSLSLRRKRVIIYVIRWYRFSERQLLLRIANLVPFAGPFSAEASDVAWFVAVVAFAADLCFCLHSRDNRRRSLESAMIVGRWSSDESCCIWDDFEARSLPTRPLT